MDPIPTYRRQRMVDAVRAGEPVAQVARRFEVSETSVRNYVKLDKEGSLDPKPRSGGPSPALDDEQRKRLKAAVDEQPETDLMLFPPLRTGCLGNPCSGAAQI